MSYQQVGNKSLKQLNRDNAAQHGTHSGAKDERDPDIVKSEKFTAELNKLAQSMYKTRYAQLENEQQNEIWNIAEKNLGRL